MLRWAGSSTIVIVLLAVTAGVVNLVTPRSLGSANLGACAMQIGDWVGEDQPVETFVLEELSPSDMLVRTYTGSSTMDRIWLVIAYFENARWGAHDPEVCYRSQGWQIENLPSRAVSRLDGAPVQTNVFRVFRREEERLVLYWWYIDEQRAMADHRDFLNSMALQGILRGSNYGSFVRVSTPVWPDRQAALDRLDRFANDIMAQLPRLISDESKESS